MLVIGSDVKREVGEVAWRIAEAFSDPTQPIYDVPFKVLREATVEEWVQSQTDREKPPSDEDIAIVRFKVRIKLAFLYVVSVD